MIEDFQQKDKSRGDRRKKNFSKALRKKKILRDVDNDERKSRTTGKKRSLHWYSKGSIYHCWYGSRVRTNKRNSVVRKPPARDKRKLLSLNEQLE